MKVEIRFSGTSLLVGLINTPIGEIYRYEEILDRDMREWNQTATRETNSDDYYQVQSDPKQFHKPSGFLGFGPWNYITLTIVGEQGLAGRLANSRGSSGQHFFNANDFSLVLPAEIRGHVATFTNQDVLKVAVISEAFKTTYVAKVCIDQLKQQTSQGEATKPYTIKVNKPQADGTAQLSQEIHSSFEDEKFAYFPIFYPLKFGDINSGQNFGFIDENERKKVIPRTLVDDKERAYRNTKTSAEDLLYLMKIKLNPSIKIQNPRANRLLACLLVQHILKRAYDEIPALARPNLVRLFSVDGFYDCMVILRGRFLATISHMVQEVDQINLDNIPDYIKNLISNDQLSTIEALKPSQRAKTPLVQLSYSVIGAPPGKIRELFDIYRSHLDKDKNKNKDKEAFAENLIKAVTNKLFQDALFHYELNPNEKEQLDKQKNESFSTPSDIDHIYPSTLISLKIGKLKAATAILEKWYNLVTGTDPDFSEFPFKISADQIKKPNIYVHTGRYDIEIFPLKEKSGKDSLFSGMTFGRFVLAHQLSKWMLLGEEYFNPIDSNLTQLNENETVALKKSLMSRIHTHEATRNKLDNLMKTLPEGDSTSVNQSHLPHISDPKKPFREQPYTHLRHRSWLLDIRTKFLLKNKSFPIEAQQDQTEDALISPSQNQYRQRRIFNYPQHLGILNFHFIRSVTHELVMSLPDSYEQLAICPDPDFNNLNSDNNRGSVIRTKILQKVHSSWFFFEQKYNEAISSDNKDPVLSSELGATAFKEFLERFLQRERDISIVSHENIESLLSTLSALDEKLKDPMTFYYYLDLAKFAHDFLKTLFSIDGFNQSSEIELYYFSTSKSEIIKMPNLQAASMTGIDSWLISMISNLQRVIGQRQTGVYPHHDRDYSRLSDVRVFHAKKIIGISWFINSLLSKSTKAFEAFLLSAFDEIKFDKNLKKQPSKERITHLLREAHLAVFGNSPEMVLQQQIMALNARQLVAPEGLIIAIHEIAHVISDYLSQIVQEIFHENYKGSFFIYHKQTIPGLFTRRYDNFLKTNNNTESIENIMISSTNNKRNLSTRNPEEKTTYFNEKEFDIWHEVFSDIIVFHIGFNNSQNHQSNSLSSQDLFLLAWIFQFLKGPPTQRTLSFKSLILRIVLIKSMLDIKQYFEINDLKKSSKHSIKGDSKKNNLENIDSAITTESEKIWNESILPFLNKSLLPLLQAYSSTFNPPQSPGFLKDQYMLYFMKILEDKSRKPISLASIPDVADFKRDLDIFWDYEIKALFQAYYAWFRYGLSRNAFFASLLWLAYNENPFPDTHQGSSQKHNGSDLTFNEFEAVKYGLRPEKWSQDKYADSFSAAAQLAAHVAQDFILQTMKTDQHSNISFDFSKLLIQDGHVGFKNHRQQQSLGRARRMITNLIWDGSLDCIREYLTDLKNLEDLGQS